MRRSPLLLALALVGCNADDTSTLAVSCDEIVALEVEHRLEAHVGRAPEADREAHRAALVDALTPTLLAECEKGRE
jgi:hypothetical protein